MKTILVPTDFSRYAGYATELAAEIALKIGAELSFIHVLDISKSGTSDYYMNYQVVQQMTHEAETRLKELQTRYGGMIETNTFLVTCPPNESVINAISSINADLIIMGSEGNNDLQSILLGSHTEKVVRNTNCPVLSIREPVQVRDFREALVAFDPETFSENYIWEIKGLHKLLDINFTFLYVKPFNSPYSHNELSLFLDTYFSRVGLSYRLKVVESSFVEDCIVEESKKSHADLIVLNTHSRKGISRLLRGSTAENIINTTLTPTLVLHLQKTDQQFLYEIA